MLVFSTLAFDFYSRKKRSKTTKRLHNEHDTSKRMLSRPTEETDNTTKTDIEFLCFTTQWYLRTLLF